MTTQQITDAEQDVTTVVDTEAGTQFSIAVRPSTAIDEILSLELDPDNDVFDVREINVGNQEFTMVFGRTAPSPS